MKLIMMLIVMMAMMKTHGRARSKRQTFRNGRSHGTHLKHTTVTYSLTTNYFIAIVVLLDLHYSFQSVVKQFGTEDLQQR